MRISEFFLGGIRNDRYSGQDKINSPMFIYQILYGKKTPRLFSGRVDHPTKIINNIPIDENIPTVTIKKLNHILDIEMRSSCQGEDKTRPAFIIFRPTNQNEDYVKRLVINLNKYNDIKSGYSMGNNGKWRVGVTTDLWYDGVSDRYTTWWLKLPDKIKKSL